MGAIKKQFLSLIKNKWTYILLAIYLVLVIIMPRHGDFYDESCWCDWTKYIRDYGLLNVYHNSAINYLPGFLYILAFLEKVFTDVSYSGGLMYAIKIITLLFDFASFILVFKILQKYKIKRPWIFAVILNIALLYNTVYWGQVDSIPTFFALAAIWAASNNKRYWSISLFLIGLTFKLQIIVLAPIVFFILITGVWQQKHRVWELIKIIGYSLAFEAILLSPFIISGALPGVITVITTSVGYYKRISMSAYNFWLLLKGDSNTSIEDSTHFIGPLTYNQVGLIMFVLAMLITLLPIISSMFKMIKAKKNLWLEKGYISMVSLAAALSVTVFFFFNTEMHERYLFAALIFFALNALVSGIPWMYILISAGFMMNMENVLGWYPSIHQLPLWGPTTAAILIAAAMILGGVYLYKIYYKLNPRSTKNR